MLAKVRKNIHKCHENLKSDENPLEGIIVTLI